MSKSTIDEIESRVTARVFQELGNILINLDIEYSGQYPDLSATLRQLGFELREYAKDIHNKNKGSQ